jgi:FkbM family methyltransferase
LFAWRAQEPPLSLGLELGQWAKYDPPVFLQRARHNSRGLHKRQVVRFPPRVPDVRFAVEPPRSEMKRMTDDAVRRAARLDGMNLFFRRFSSKPGMPAAVRALAKVGAMSLTFRYHPIAAKSFIRSVGRELAWQMWRRTVRRPVTVELHDGSSLICPQWSALSGSLIAVGIPDLAELSFVVSVIRPGEFLVDVGAHIGLYTIVAARQGARVLAFEPSQCAREALLASARLNGVEASITCFSCALSNKNATARFTTGLDVGNHLVEVTDARAASASIEVEMRSLDDVLASLPDKAVPRVIKVDVEGSDLDVLRGAEGILVQARPFVVIEVWDGGREVRAWLEERGYVVYAYDSKERVLRELPADFRAWQFNFVCVHKSRLEEARNLLAAGESPVLRPPRVNWFQSPWTRSTAPTEQCHKGSTAWRSS